MVVMRWLIALGLIAGCGRLGFDPLDENGGGPGDEGNSGGLDIDAGPGSGGGSDSGTTIPTGHYITGGMASTGSPASSISTMTGPLTDSNMVLVVAIHWRDTTSSVTTVQDSFGNGFSMAGSMARYNAQQSQVLWVKRITAGTTINVIFNQPAASISLKWAAYRDITQSSPYFSSARSASGTGTAVATGAVPLPQGVVVVASAGSRATSASAGPGFTQRHVGNGGVLEDIETLPGALNATATLSSANDWIIHMVALHPL